MTAAYSIFANKGVYNTPMMVSRIEDKYGNVLAEFRPESREVITAQTAYLMCNLLEGVVNSGTGIRLRLQIWFYESDGRKNGNDTATFGWLVMAVTPGLVGGVWVGAEDRSIHFQNITNGQGASMALPIWAKFLGKVIKDPKLKFDTLPFEKPAGVSKIWLSG